jgi:mRNA interferase MazF
MKRIINPKFIPNSKESLNAWSKEKEGFYFKKSSPFFKEREIWWTAIGFNIGDEQNGKNKNFERPILILKKFNNYIFIGLPLTSKLKKGKYYQEVKVIDRSTSVILSQLRLYDAKRLIRKITILDEGLYDLVKNRAISNIKNGSR